MSTPTREEITPVPVAIHASYVPLGGGGAERKIYRSLYNTLVLSAANDAEEILPASDNREIAWIQPLDDDCVIHGLASDAARGNGTRIPKANNAPYPIQDSGTVYVAVPVMAGATSRITISAVYCEKNTVRNQAPPGTEYG